MTATTAIAQADAQFAAWVKADPWNKRDPLAIPDYLRIPPSVRLANWAKAPPPAPMPNFAERKAPPGAKTLEWLAEQEAAEKVRTANRIAKMKAGLQAKARKPDMSRMTWDGRRGRWLWAGTYHPVRFNADGTPQPDTALVHPAQPTTGHTPKETIDMKKTSKKAAKKVAKKKVAKAAGAGKAPGIIATIKDAISRAGGASVQETLDILRKKFPDREPRDTTVRINANLFATKKVRDDKRGLVYYIK